MENFAFENDAKSEQSSRTSNSPTKESETDHNLLYSIEDTPAWYTCFVLGLQHYLVAIGSVIGLPLLIAPSLCIENDEEGNVARALLISSLLFVSGLCTLLQTTLGIRLPIMQGGTFSFLPPTLAILALPHNQCPAPLPEGFMNSSKTLYNDTDGSIVDGTEVWQRRMREVQGAIAVASSLQVILGFSGAIGFLLRYIGPLTIAPAVALIGLDLFSTASYNAEPQWGIAMLFYFPYPGQWGLPTVTVAGVVGMLAGVVAGFIESIGDYYACARLSGAPNPPQHAINRGIFVEGIGCILAGVIGTGTATTSFSENIGAIGITRVGSRRVLQVAGVLFLILGMLSKFGSIFVTIPDPVIGGLFCVAFGMITAVGLSNLQYIDFNSPRNLFIVGASLFMGLAVPEWMKANPGVIQTSVIELDQIITVLLQTSMLVGGFLAFFFDNTIPGTENERGLLAWRTNRYSTEGMQEEELKKAEKECYNLPFPTNCCRCTQQSLYKIYRLMQ
ncbi:unnamed protein product [Clavelina lepadiformis]|uniref:Uncharacterized protein n=1 Tax=Clavelina lepadiformis TaxID=159417 RepID=A0ABP0FSQ1_CLALP